MPNPGIGDPYWFEWYVGLKYIIEMLNPDSGINCVIFQHETYKTIDDIVVEYNNGTSQLCYQIKHEIATSQPNNLTFGKLVDKEKNEKCLFEALFLGWKKASSEMKTTIKPVLYTNRKILNRRAGRTACNGNNYSAYPVDQFLSSMQAIFENTEDYSNIVIKDPALMHQWEELCSALKIEDKDIPEAANFLKHLTIALFRKILPSVATEFAFPVVWRRAVGTAFAPDIIILVIRIAGKRFPKPFMWLNPIRRRSNPASIRRRNCCHPSIR